MRCNARDRIIYAKSVARSWRRPTVKSTMKSVESLKWKKSQSRCSHPHQCPSKFHSHSHRCKCQHRNRQSLPDLLQRCPSPVCQLSPNLLLRCHSQLTQILEQEQWSNRVHSQEVQRLKMTVWTKQKGKSRESCRKKPTHSTPNKWTGHHSRCHSSSPGWTEWTHTAIAKLMRQSCSR